jgi:hypothetical protein
MGERPALRASDGDRERAAADIREHCAPGRLRQDELAERLERAYAAETTAELDQLRADLPPLPPASRRAELAERRAELSRRLAQETGAAAAPFLICTVIWLLSGANGDFWPAWLLLIPAILLFKNGWRLYGPAPELDRVAQDLARRSRRHGTRRPRH